MSDLPKGFSYLEDIDPSIHHHIAYATENNLLGRPLAGYEAPQCIVSDAVGHALKQAQEWALKLDLSLKVYDAYRPLRAVEDIVFWAGNLEDTVMKKDLYPNINKADFFTLGYVGLRSYHCRGAAVDVTLCSPTHPDRVLDMGTPFDFMDILSHTLNPTISPEAQKNRELLCAIMHASGFKNYEKEWWHFNLVDEPFPDTYFDFPVK